jgi:hypothetical protein
LEIILRDIDVIAMLVFRACTPLRGLEIRAKSP